MSNLSIAYIFQQQQLLVDEQFQLPRVEKLHSDLVLSDDEQVVARDLLPNESIPVGYQLVPIRQLLQYWNHQQFEQASRAVQLLEWRRNHQFCGRCGTKTTQSIEQFAGVPAGNPEQSFVFFYLYRELQLLFQM